MNGSSTTLGARDALTLADPTLPRHASRVDVPSYDRAALTPAVVHFGVGGFHRAHQAVYLDRLAEQQVSSDWGVVGVGLRSDRMKAALHPQRCLYTVIERDAEGDTARVIGAMTDYHFAPERPAAVLRLLADPRTRVATLTVTGDGYGVDPETGEVDVEDPGVARDLRRPESPTTLPGYLVEGLRRRREAGAAPFSILSCDNVPRNGLVTRGAVVSFARQRDAALADWIDAQVAFPNSVVDRITPETTRESRRLVAEKFGIADRWPVVTERYAQWVVEDCFSNGRPPLEDVGAEFVPDVAAHELVKKRLLNGSHCAIGYVGSLCGHRRIDHAMSDPAVRAYVHALMDSEITPLLPRPLKLDLGAYKAQLVERFSNPAIADRLERLCARGSTKMPAYLLPSLAEALQQGRRHGMLTLAVAAWIAYLRRLDASGNPVPAEDPRRDTLQPLARIAGTDPRPLLSERAIFGSLGENEAFVKELKAAIQMLDTQNPAAAVRGWLAQDCALAA